MESKTVETTNPVIDTARLTLSQLAAAGVQEAKDLAEHLGLTQALENYYASADQKMVLVNAVMQESRYDFMNRYFLQAGNQNILDIACGFSPRGLMTARKGKNYLGLDLESAVKAMSQVAATVTEKGLPGTLRYRLVDITNPAALLEAADTLEGPMVMGCEGLLVYLSVNEFESLIQGVSAVLHKHGGCFVSPDFVTKHFFFNTYAATMGKEAAMQAMLALGKSIESKSDTRFSNTVTHNGLEPCYPIFEKYGLEYELIPYLPLDASLESFRLLTAQQIDAMHQLMTPVMGLRLTPKAGFVSNTAFSSGAFKTSAQRMGSVVTFSLDGRLDSTTAPKLLEFFEDTRKQGTVSAITLDMSELEYISSAGLRTLLIMQKSLNNSRISILHPNALVTEILEQTGFIEIFDMH